MAIKLTCMGKLNGGECHRGHENGDCFDYEKDRGKLCPMALHVGFPYIDIIKYGGKAPLSSAGDVRFCCPDPDVANIFKITEE